MTSFANLAAAIRPIHTLVHRGRVVGSQGDLLIVSGLSGRARVGDYIFVGRAGSESLAEVVGVHGAEIRVLAQAGATGSAVDDPVSYVGPRPLYPDRSWLGRILDGFANPLDGRPLLQGLEPIDVARSPPPATQRRALGERLETGLAPFNTFLPIVTGQRIGLFAGSGVGKTTLLGTLCRNIQADVIVLAMVGERGREIMQFVEDNLDAETRKRMVVVASTSDQPAFLRRRAGLAAITVAEYFRDIGKNVLFLCDSLTRFAEANREVAISNDESFDATGFPPSTGHAVMNFCERAGPGVEGTGDISAIFSVLVAGSDMDGPIADLVRGVLDGHVILSREIAERGRFPAIDVLRSASRTLQAVTSDARIEVLTNARRLMATYRDIEIMLQTGLYAPGSDPETDEAIEARPKLEAFMTIEGLATHTCFDRLSDCLEKPKSGP